MATVLFYKGNNKGHKQGKTTALPWNPAVLQPPVVALVLVAGPDVDVASLLLVFLLFPPLPASSSITFFGPIWPGSMNSLYADM